MFFFFLSHLPDLWSSLYMSHCRPVRRPWSDIIFWYPFSLVAFTKRELILLEINRQKGYTTNYGIGNPIESFLWFILRFTLLCVFLFSPCCTAFPLHWMPLDQTRENCITRCLEEPSTFKSTWHISFPFYSLVLIIITSTNAIADPKCQAIRRYGVPSRSQLPTAQPDPTPLCLHHRY